MAYRFKLKEPIRKGVRRIGVAQIGRAIKLLSAGQDQNAEIHGARKAIKRTRALLRLVKPSISRRDFDELNGGLRDVAARLSGARDRHVMIETLHKLQAAAGKGVSAAKFNTLIRHFSSADGKSEAFAPPETIADAIAGLSAQRDQLADLECDGTGFEIIEEGLSAGYRAGREAFDIAYAGGDDETFHDLRKGLQLHWRHMSLLARAWPEFFDVRVSAARELSQILGDEHDLSVLIAYLNGLTADTIVDPETIISLATERRNVLRTAAEGRTARIYAERPRDFVQRIKIYWDLAPAIIANEIAVEPDEPADAARHTARPAAKARAGARRTSRPAR